MVIKMSLIQSSIELKTVISSPLRCFLLVISNNKIVDDPCQIYFFHNSDGLKYEIWNFSGYLGKERKPWDKDQIPEIAPMRVAGYSNSMLGGG